MIQATIDNLQQRDPEALRALLWGDEWLEAALRAFKTRLDNAERDAVRLYFETIGTVGAQGDRTTVLLLGAIGVSNAEEARRMVAAAREAEDADVPQLRQQWLTFGRALMRDPAFREKAREVLFGERAALPEASGAVVVETNGHAKRNGKAKRNGNGRHA